MLIFEVRQVREKKGAQNRNDTGKKKKATARKFRKTEKVVKPAINRKRI